MVGGGDWPAVPSIPFIPWGGVRGELGMYSCVGIEMGMEFLYSIGTCKVIVNSYVLVVNLNCY